MPSSKACAEIGSATETLEEMTYCDPRQYSYFKTCALPLRANDTTQKPSGYTLKFLSFLCTPFYIVSLCSMLEYCCIGPLCVGSIPKFTTSGDSYIIHL